MNLAGLRVLIVEDEVLVAMLMEEYLLELGCNVMGIAADLDDALEKAHSVELDAAVVDVNLAGRSSYQVGQVLRDRGVWVIMATGYGAGSLPPEFQGTPLLSKPFHQEQLADALQLARRG